MTVDLDQAQLQADPLADQTIAGIVGTWEALSPSTSAVEAINAQAMRWQRLAAVSKLFEQWTTNAALVGWTAQAPGLTPAMLKSLDDYVASARVLPDWADAAKIARAETLFYEDGVMSCLLLFCASLPECYVIPDLSAVLHASGQLEKHTDYRIRATAAMIFPVMLKGGLTDPVSGTGTGTDVAASAGAGVAQVLKVRLIHATIRNLILHGEPSRAATVATVVPPLASLRSSQNMHHALFAHGWNIAADGLPCNQEELAYTLLTFGYVYLRGMRCLGIGLEPADEEAMLHAWNVMAHLLGIRRELMVDTMDEAEALFERMQARGRTDPSIEKPDPRPPLAAALMQTMEDVIPLRILKPFPVLLTRMLCGADNASDLGLDGRVGWPSRLLFWLVMTLARGIDWVVRLVLPEFSLTRFISRVVGYSLLTKLLMDQTRPLKLPEHLLSQVAGMADAWSDDPKAPRWLNALEDRLTTRGSWNSTRKA